MNESVKLGWFGLHRGQTAAQIFWFLVILVNFHFKLFLVTFLFLILAKYKILSFKYSFIILFFILFYIILYIYIYIYLPLFYFILI